jgi:hypothetical protein
VEQEGFLAPGLVLFGDNAYVNTPYMATPYRGVSSGPEDAYNFYHSQLRISIECAFGMLVQRWGILRKPIPKQISIAKMCALVLCLCKLHNFCIDMNEGKAASSTGIDAAIFSVEGGIYAFDRRGNPTELIGGGDQFVDDPLRSQRRHGEDDGADASMLPRELLHQVVIRKDLRQPPPHGKHCRTLGK